MTSASTAPRRRRARRLAGGRPLASAEDAPASGRSADLSAGAVALLNAIASVAPAAQDPWSAFPPVLDVEHVAEILGMTPGSTREGARRGQIPMVRRLNRYMVDQAVFRRWLSGYDVWAEGLVPTTGAGGV